ncbi:MAG: YhcH/YjgK/YiaL family protein [Lachnospirales bacterium]
MIVDSLKNIRNFDSINKDFKNIIDFALTLKDKPDGKYEIGKNFVLVQSGKTKPIKSVPFESHLKYIDVQILLEGQEYQEWIDVDKLDLLEKYDAVKDVAFYVGEGSKIKIDSGMFSIFFPWDAHKACVHVDGESDFKKLVVKLKLN